MCTPPPKRYRKKGTQYQWLKALNRQNLFLPPYPARRQEATWAASVAEVPPPKSIARSTQSAVFCDFFDLISGALTGFDIYPCRTFMCSIGFYWSRFWTPGKLSLDEEFLACRDQRILCSCTRSECKRQECSGKHAL